ncbi:MAG TPA: ribosomal L7Ae/L30e/S12e/Gadd45 family protein [Patescibacteria group bacterium]|nr:ribosomal L7Ae/L30e/S12e/Gadd45 family protein [Patescibacteria group bacterium]
MNENKLMSLLGLAQKARKVASGELAVESAVRAGKAGLILLARDASDNAKKNYRDLAAHYRVECEELLTKEQLGNCTGKAPRAALALLDEGFRSAVKKLLNEEK